MAKESTADTHRSVDSDSGADTHQFGGFESGAGTHHSVGLVARAKTHHSVGLVSCVELQSIEYAAVAAKGRRSLRGNKVAKNKNFN